MEVSYLLLQLLACYTRKFETDITVEAYECFRSLGA